MTEPKTALPTWHPVYDTTRAIFCAVLLAAMGLEIYEHGGAWSVVLAAVLIGGMAS